MLLNDLLDIVRDAENIQYIKFIHKYKLLKR